MYEHNIIYHVYNQSINYELLFRSWKNYQVFLSKCRTHLLPHADIFAYCLMPDHFHFMLKPTELGCQLSKSGRFLKLGETGPELRYQQNLSQAFKTILSSYTQKVNRAFKRRGSLFKAKTKAKPGYQDFCPEIDLIEGKPFTHFVPYLRTCFHYIHNNPQKADYVLDPLDWEFSSAMDYEGLRDSMLCNFELTEKLLGIKRKPPKSNQFTWRQAG